MWEIWGREPDPEKRVENMMMLCERFSDMDKHFQKLTRVPQPQFAGTDWWDPAFEEYRVSLFLWCVGLAYEYFGFRIPKNLKEHKIEWFDEVVLMV